MASPRDDTLWDLAPHTMGKHRVLRRYLDAWLPIMAKANQRILFVDGFAGPGRYKGGEDGSPVIAMKALLEHNHRAKMNTEVSFIFIEKQKDRVEHLSAEIEPLKEQLGKQASVQIWPGTFDETMMSALRSIDEQKKRLAPAFVMVDPFGVSDTPMSVLERILKNDKSELYVSFMWEYFNRFKRTPEFDAHLDGLLGSDAWRKLIDIDNWRDRKNAIFDLYRTELKKRGAKFVLHFELYEGATLKYAIFFATKHELGCDKMKEAIWKVDPISGHAFVAGKNDSVSLFDQQNVKDFTALKEQLRRKFGGTATKVETICAWMKTDETYFYSGQMRSALRELEKDNLLTVVDGTRKRAGTHPDGTVLTLKPL